MLVQSLRLDSNMFDTGALLGTRGHQEVLQEINRNAGGSYFGSQDDPFRQKFQNYITQIVEPIRMASNKLETFVENVTNTDKFRPITSVQELAKGIPPCMQLPILYFEPVRAMLDEGIIDGFGIDPDTLEKDDPYKKMCESGVCTINSGTIDENGRFDIEFYWSSADPDLTPEEIMDIYVTRQFIDKFLKNELTKYMDPTDYPNIHG